MILCVNEPGPLGGEKCNPITACPEKTDDYTEKVYFTNFWLSIKFTYKSFEYTVLLKKIEFLI
jgi:hypothetical protein